MSTHPTEDAPGALEGLRILDLAGPMGVYCARLLADLGADVLRVEPLAGSPARFVEPFYGDEPGLERSLFHWHFNANKRGVTLDILTPAGQALFKRLVERADVVVETFQPGYLDSLGLGYEALAGVNPRVILTSITPFGQTGPFRDYLGEELIGQAAGGLLWLCGWTDRPPVMMGGWPGMHQASTEAAAGTLVALEFREQTGQGQQVDASVQGSLPLSAMASLFEYYVTGRERARAGDYHPGPLNGMFACKDGYVDFRFRARPGRWDRIVAWMDSLGMAEDLGEERWRDTLYRGQPEHQRHVEEVFQRFILHFNREEAMDLAQRVGMEVGAVYAADDLLRDPQLQARQYFVEVEHQDLGRSFTYPGAPYGFSETPWRLRRRAPLLGEHNHDLYEGELGLSRREIDALRADRVI